MGGRARGRFALEMRPPAAHIIRAANGPEPHPRRREAELSLVAVGTVLCAIAATITASRPSSQYASFEAFARATVVGAPIAVGFYAWRRPSFERFGKLLIGVGVAAFLATLSE